ncbi:MAG: hypothetical protein DRO46_00105 [Candidatus Hecatellales archaeon]|nr:MAG: hypothetical protein DRO46_00105 [Candidatus Hecatellales archaeon]
MPGSVKLAERYAVKVYYEGEAYYGFQPLKDKPTVGGVILRALQESGLISDRREAIFQAASRTDRGVSALGQTIAFNTREKFSLGRLNAYLPEDVRAWAWSKVPLNFNPRKQALRRRYLYVAPYGGEDFKAMVEASHLLAVHLQPPVEVKLRLEDSLIHFTFTSKSFVRGLIRRLVSLLLKAGRGEFSLKELEEKLGGEGLASLRLPLAPPEPLLLLDVEYGFPFQVDESELRRLLGRLAWKACRLETFKACLKLLGERLAQL